MKPCDHYWLVRRGGVCRHCKQRFEGQFADVSPQAMRILQAETHVELATAVEAVLKAEGR